MTHKKIEELNFIEAVSERDMDLLLLEELIVSKEFREWFIKQATGESIKNFVGAWHSICDSNSEFDLLLIFMSESGKKYALFIEDKVGAMAQKDQSKRYALRGEEGIVRKEWDASTTCIVAPENYLETNEEAHKYPCSLSYESIQKWFLDHPSERHEFKSKIVKEAIEQNRRGYTPIPDKKTTDFWIKYYRHVLKNYPELEMTEPSPRPIASNWMYFHPKKWKNKMEIVHKGSHGFADLQIYSYGKRMEEISEKLKPFVERDMEILNTKKSALVRIVVPKTDSTADFDSQIDKIRGGLEASKRLLALGKQIIDKI